LLFLLAASLLWSLSFGIIKEQLTELPSDQVAFLRLAIATVGFAPFMRGALGKRAGLLMGIGAVQFGAMYLLYLEAYQYLAAYEVALFTIFTPVWVLVFDGLSPGALRRTWTARNLVAVAAAVVGAGIVLYRAGERPGLGTGFVLMQVANICFALGQVTYRRLVGGTGGRPRIREDAGSMAWAYLGGTLVAAVAGLLSETDWQWQSVGLPQVAALGYLGLIASGLGFFFWNAGARRVGVGLLATMNNLKVPLAVAVSLFLFGEEVHSSRLLIGAGLVLAALVLQRGGEPRASK